MTTAIKIENVSKLYRLGEVGTGSLAHDLNRWWHRLRGKEDPYTKIGQVNDRTKKSSVVSGQSSGTNSTENCQPATANFRALSPDYVWALKDINLEVKQGEILGIIGRNGAGKSTLLKILSRVTQPTAGSIRAKGRIASLLEVGTGFHPELTGRENIYLNGGILGMRRYEIAGKLDEIIAFSGCERYIDTPVKRYSSGMYVRLAFAVAAHLETEIMIIDEVLAVGDAEFQSKCLGKMQDIGDSGRTVIFVSHNLGAVRQLCSEVVLIENGTKTFQGPAGEGLSRYEHSFSSFHGGIAADFHGPLSKSIRFSRLAYKQGDCEVTIADPLKDLEIVLRGKSDLGFQRLEVKLGFFRDGFFLASCFDCIEPAPIMQGEFACSFHIPACVLRPGRYSLGVGASANLAMWTWGGDVATLEVSENYGNQPAHRSEGVLALPHLGRRTQNYSQILLDR